MTGYLLLRAAGGNLVHAVDPVSGTAACGHHPESKTTHFMKPRARWFTIIGNYDAVTCHKCKTKRLRQVLK